MRSNVHRPSGFGLKVRAAALAVSCATVVAASSTAQAQTTSSSAQPQATSSAAQLQFPQNTAVTNISGFGDPLGGIKVEAALGINGDLQTFATGQLNFMEVDSLPELGPIFNSRSCGACHSQPAIGGSGEFINEVRVRNNTAGGPVHIFAADAYLNEVGVTSPDAPADRSACALNQTQFGVLLDASDDPEDTTDTNGRADIDRFADFQRALAPPPQLQQNASAQAGHTLFQNIGCAGCHVETITTASNAASFIPRTTGGVPISNTLNAILSSNTFHPFGDFLLHDMGSLGDGITSGVAGPTMMRTAPLWGVRAKSRLLHDGRAESVADAIGFHDGQGAAARNAFQALSPAQQQRVLDFLNTI